MTLKEAAALLGISPDTLKQQAQLGHLKAVKHGFTWWVTPGEIERYRAERLGRAGRYSRETNDPAVNERRAKWKASQQAYRAKRGKK